MTVYYPHEPIHCRAGGRSKNLGVWGASNKLMLTLSQPGERGRLWPPIGFAFLKTFPDYAPIMSF